MIFEQLYELSLDLKMNKLGESGFKNLINQICGCKKLEILKLKLMSQVFYPTSQEKTKIGEVTELFN